MKPAHNIPFFASLVAAFLAWSAAWTLALFLVIRYVTSAKTAHLLISLSVMVFSLGFFESLIHLAVKRHRMLPNSPAPSDEARALIATVRGRAYFAIVIGIGLFALLGYVL